MKELLTIYATWVFCSLTPM